jgi:hypothetical protein
MFSARRNYWLISGLLVIAALLTTCAAPTAVREFTAVAKEAAGFPPLVKDISESCIRRQLAERPVDEIAEADDQARAACRNFSDLEPRLKARYMYWLTLLSC